VPALGQRFVFSGSNPGGAWYIMAGGVYTLFNDRLGDYWAMDIMASGGSVENIRRMAMGDTDFIIVHLSHILDGISGIGVMEGVQYDGARVVCFAFAGAHTFVVRADSGIYTMSDLVGHTVSIGAPGSGISCNSRRILTALGLYDQIDIVEMAHADGGRAMQDGLIQSLGISSHPMANVVELANLHEIRLLSFTDEEMATIIAHDASFVPGILAANTYVGQTEEVQVASFPVLVAAADTVPDAVVYALMTEMFSADGHQLLINTHAQWATIREGMEFFVDSGAIFHPGAIAFFEANPQFR